jgi:hypothetical protein
LELKKKIFKKSPDFRKNMRFFLLFYILNGQIWLIWPANDHNLGYFTKLKNDCRTPNFNVGKVLYIFLRKTMNTLFS